MTTGTSVFQRRPHAYDRMQPACRLHAGCILRSYAGCMRPSVAPALRALRCMRSGWNRTSSFANELHYVATHRYVGRPCCSFLPELGSQRPRMWSLIFRQEKTSSGQKVPNLVSVLDTTNLSRPRFEMKQDI